MAAKFLLIAVLAGVTLALPQSGYNYNAPQPAPSSPTNLYQTPQQSPSRPAPPPRPAPTPRPTPPPRPAPAPQAGYGLPASSSNLVPQNAPPGGGVEGMPYDFQWGVDDSESGNSFSHVENSDGQTTQGEYRVLLPDGRTQVVKFFDNGGGFNAEVTYE